LKVYNLLGELVKELVNEYKPEGRYTAEFNGSNLASGVYIYELSSNDFTSIKKMILMK
jgi:hypothetical protein